MSYQVDSDVVVEWLRGNQLVVQQLNALEDAGLAISLITFGEVYDGIYFGRDPQRAERVFRMFLRGVSVLPLNRTIMRRFAQLRGNLRRAGQPVPDPDLMIAATALQHGLTLISGNLRHFQRISDLPLIDMSSYF